MAAYSISYSVQNWGNIMPGLVILAEMLGMFKFHAPEHNSFSWLPPLPVHKLMCEHHALSRKTITRFVYGPRAWILPLSHSSTGFQLDDLFWTMPLSSVLIAWAHLISAWGLQSVGTGNQAEGFMLSLLMHQGLFWSVLLYKNRNSKKVLWSVFQPASLGLLVQAAIWLGALINQASGVDRKHLQPAVWATKSKTQQELLINSMKQNSEN